MPNLEFHLTVVSMWAITVVALLYMGVAGSMAISAVGAIIATVVCAVAILS